VDRERIAGHLLKLARELVGGGRQRIESFVEGVLNDSIMTEDWDGYFEVSYSDGDGRMVIADASDGSVSPRDTVVTLWWGLGADGSFQVVREKWDEKDPGYRRDMAKVLDSYEDRIGDMIGALGG